MIKLITLFALLISCDKYHPVKFSNGLHYIEDLNFSLSNVEEIEWQVGRKKDKTISQGFIFEIDIPKLENEDAETLYNKYGIDSWLFKIRKITPKVSQTIGLVQYKFENFSSNADQFSVKVLYHAASISLDFRRFHCPAFGHRFKIEDYDLLDNSFKQKNLYTTLERKIRRRVSETSFTILSYSGGRSLNAKFLVELSFYNSKTKQHFGKPVTSQNIINIYKESSVTLPSCLGIKEEITPLPESRPAGLRDLEIKK